MQPSSLILLPLHWCWYDLTKWWNLCGCDSSFQSSISSPSCTRSLLQMCAATLAINKGVDLCGVSVPGRTWWWLLGGGFSAWATASCHQKSSFHGTTWSPHHKHFTSYLGVLVGVFPRRRAVHTLVEYRRRGNSFSFVPSHIQMSNSETKVVVFLSVNR